MDVRVIIGLVSKFGLEIYLHSHRLGRIGKWLPRPKRCAIIITAIWPTHSSRFNNVATIIHFFPWSYKFLTKIKKPCLWHGRKKLHCLCWVHNDTCVYISLSKSLVSSKEQTDYRAPNGNKLFNLCHSQLWTRNKSI